MNSLSQSLEEYLALRRGLGFKLKQDGRLLSQFVSCYVPQYLPQ
jgi:hypothetical protein